LPKRAAHQLNKMETIPGLTRGFLHNPPKRCTWLERLFWEKPAFIRVPPLSNWAKLSHLIKYSSVDTSYRTNARLGAVESQPKLLSVKWPNFVVILVLP